MKQFLSRPHPARRRVITTRHLASPVLGVGEAQIDRMLAQKNGGRREEVERKKKKRERKTRTLSPRCQAVSCQGEKSCCFS